MVKQAVILADMQENPFAGRWNKAKPLKKLLGLSFLKRAILTAEASGVQSFVVVLGPNDALVKTAIEKDKQLKTKNLQIEFVLNKDYRKNSVAYLKEVKGHLQSEPFFFYSCDTIFPKAVLDNLNSKLKENTVMNFIAVDENFAEKEKKPFWIGIEKDETDLVISLKDMQEAFNGISTGIYLFQTDVFSFFEEEVISEEQTFESFLSYWVNKKQFLSVNTSKFFWNNIHSQLDYVRAEKDLMNSVRKPTDGFIARNINRYISLFISKQLLRFHITPNVVTAGNLVIGILSAYFIAMGGYFYSLIAALLFQLASITDGCDGEVAKLTYRSSRYGEWFDTACDNITYIAFLTFLPVGLYRYHQNLLYVVLGVLTFVAGIFFVVSMISYMNKIRGGGSMVKIVKDMEADAEFDMRNWRKTINFIIAKIAFTMRRDFFAFFFLLLCLVGVSFLIQWLAACALTFASVYFFYYSRRQIRLMEARA